MPANGAYPGIGWDSVAIRDNAYTVYKDGTYQGMRTFMKRTPNGVSWCLLYNASMNFDAVDMQIAGTTVHEVRRLVEGIEKYPDVDFFKEYR